MNKTTQHASNGGGQLAVDPPYPLTEDEFLKLEGDQPDLAGLGQEEYVFTRDEADKHTS